MVAVISAGVDPAQNWVYIFSTILAIDETSCCATFGAYVESLVDSPLHQAALLQVVEVHHEEFSPKLVERG